MQRILGCRAWLTVVSPLKDQSQPVLRFADDESTVGYVVTPEGEGPFPAVILIHEWNGLVDRVRQVADALADEGYVALAADMYSGQIGTSREENMALMQEAQADPERVIANLDTLSVTSISVAHRSNVLAAASRFIDLENADAVAFAT